MIKRQFIFCFFGDTETYKCSDILLNNYNNSKSEAVNKLKTIKLPDYRIYVLGKDNFDFLASYSDKCVLADNKSMPFSQPKRHWLNKIFALDIALKDYDEIIYMDFDCEIISEITWDIFDEFSRKEVIQSCLVRYLKNGPKALHRKENVNFLPNGGFIYIRDKKIPSELLKLDPPVKWTDETYMSMYIDSISGGWKGTEYYFDHFEPECCRNWNGVFNNRKPNILFKHKTI